MNIKYEDLTEMLWRRLPWLRETPEYHDLMQLWEGEQPSPHISFGDVLVPVLVRMLGAVMPEDERVAEAFLFIEELVASSDESISSVGVTTVLEGLHGARNLRSEVRRRLGPESLRFARRIEHDWG